MIVLLAGQTGKYVKLYRLMIASVKVGILINASDGVVIKYVTFISSNNVNLLKTACSL